MSDISVFFQNFIRYSLRVQWALLFSLFAWKKICWLQVDPSGSGAFCTLALAIYWHYFWMHMHCLIIIKHSSYSETFQTLFHTILHILFTLFPSIYLLPKLTEAKNFVICWETNIVPFDINFRAMAYRSHHLEPYISQRQDILCWYFILL